MKSSNSIQKVTVEIVAPDQRKKAEQIEAYIGEMVNRKVAEIMARQDLAVMQPFFESKKIADELRRIQTAPDWHKFRVYYERWGCLVCATRTEIHRSLGMCPRCYRRTNARLKTICKELNEKSERAEGLIEQERLAYKALIESGIEIPESDTARVGRPKTLPQIKPSILAGDPGARVRQLRELAGMSQSDLAKAAGVDCNTIIRLERGDHWATPGKRAAIRRVLVDALVRAFWPD